VTVAADKRQTVAFLYSKGFGKIKINERHAVAQRLTSEWMCAH